MLVYFGVCCPLPINHPSMRTNHELIECLVMAVVVAGFTHCPDICPAELTKMASALDFLGAPTIHPDTHTIGCWGTDVVLGRADKRKDVGLDTVQPIFITIDPKRDTQPVIKQYAEGALS